MQINYSPRLIKSFMLGLVASSAGALVALPGTAMPKPGENAATIESVEMTDEDTAVIEDTAVESVDELPTPTAEETLPSPEEALEEDAADDEMTEADAEMTDETVVEEDTDEAADTEAADVGEEINTEDFTIAELTDSSDSFTILAAALAATDLTEVLAEEGPYTIFAPTDDAFEALPEGALEQLLLPENKEVLTQILSYHVVPGALLSTDLESGSIATVEGSEVTIEVEADGVTVDNANIFLPDVQASNGVIHVIDRVILPPTPETDAEAESPDAAQ